MIKPPLWLPLHRYVKCLEPGTSRILLPNRRLTRSSPVPHVGCRWQIIDIYRRALLLLLFADISYGPAPSGRTLISRATVLTLFVSEVTTVLSRRRVKTLIHIWIKLLIVLEPALGVPALALKKLLPCWMTFEDVRMLIHVEKGVIWPVIVGDAIKLGSSHLCCGTYYIFELIMLKVPARGLDNRVLWRVLTCGGRVVHGYLLLRMKSSHGTGGIPSDLLNEHQRVLLLRLAVVGRVLKLFLDTSDLISESAR